MAYGPTGQYDEVGNPIYGEIPDAAPVSWATQYQQSRSWPIDTLYAQFAGVNGDPASGMQVLATLRAAGANEAQLRAGLDHLVANSNAMNSGAAGWEGLSRLAAQGGGINLDPVVDQQLAAAQTQIGSTTAAEQAKQDDSWDQYGLPIGITLAMLGAAGATGGFGAAGADGGITMSSLEGAHPTLVSAEGAAGGLPELYGPDQLALLEQAGQTPLYGPEQMDLLNRASGGAGYNVGPGYPSVPPVNMQFPSVPSTPPKTSSNLATRAATSLASNAISGALKPTGANVDDGAFAGTLTDQAGRDELKSRIKGYFSGADRSQDLYDSHMAVYGEELGKRATTAERERRQQLARQSLIGGSVQADLSAKASEEESIGATRASEAARSAANRYKAALGSEEQNAYALADAGNPEAVNLASRSADLAYENALSKQNVDDLFGGLFQPIASGASLYNAANAQQAANLALLDRYRKAGQLYSSPSSRARVTGT